MAIKDGLGISEYQFLAARTINTKLTKEQLLLHALHGLIAEAGEIHGLYQKVYQGHPLDEDHLDKEIGDLTWFVAELCTARGRDFGKICQMNVNKLKKRYPMGFSEQNSLHREEGDV